MQKIQLPLEMDARYLSRTYTFDPILPDGDWTEADGVKSCANYRLETRELPCGTAARLTLTNTGKEAVTLHQLRFAGKLPAPVDSCVVYTVEEVPFRFYNTMGAPSHTHKMLPEDTVEGCDLIPFRDVSGLCGVLGFITNEHFFADLRLRENGAFRVNQNTERRVLEVGETIESDWFYVGFGETADEALKGYMEALCMYSNVGKLPAVPPTGWCTWYYYLMNIRQETIRENLKILSERKEQLPVKIVQIDDGWYKNWGDWTENEVFSDGMKTLADEIRAEGFIPGIWLCPFSASGKSETAAKHPEAFVRNSDGKGFAGGHNLALDPTSPEGERILREVFHRLSYEWGYRYIKLDYMIAGVQPGLRHDPKASSLESMRRGLRIIRESVTPDTFLLACTAPMVSAIGLCEGMRISCDIGESWESLKEVLMRVFKRYYYNGRAYVTDPDCLMVREREQEDEDCMRLCTRNASELQVFMTGVAASGGIFMMSDKLKLLNEQRFEWLSRLLPVNTHTAVPLDLFDTDIPGILDFGDYGDTRVCALINWSDDEKTMTVPASCMAGKQYIFEFWEQKNCGKISENTAFVLPPHSARVYWLENELRTEAKTIVPAE